MAHLDHETRVGAHSIFSIVLVPWLKKKMNSMQAVSGFPSVSRLDIVKDGSFSIKDKGKDTGAPVNGEMREEESRISDVCESQSGKSCSFKRALTGGRTVWDLKLIFQS
jgi:hypothetical protein